MCDLKIAKLTFGRWQKDTIYVQLSETSQQPFMCYELERFSI